MVKDTTCIKNGKKYSFLLGVRLGVPIGLGYFAVAFSLGIMAKKVGLTWFQGYVASFLNMASAGEYALFTAIGEHATYLELAFMTMIINARYLLMSASLSQKFNRETGLLHRMLVGFVITDEIFGITVSRKGDVDPFFNYGAIAVASPCWCIGTALGIVAGNILPGNVVSALSVALYGMFIAIIIPPAKKNRAIMVAVLAGFALSFFMSVAPVLNSLSEGNRTIILTVIIAAVLAIIKPVEDGENDEG